MPVSNATPLIYLARLGKLPLLRELFAQIQIPPEVKNETIDRGKEKGFPDAIIIEQALKDGWLAIHQLTEENIKKSETLAQMSGIDIGEAQTILLAKQKNEKIVLIDQTSAREVARQMGLYPRGTIYIILAAAKKKLTTKEEARQMLEKLIETNFYISAKIYRDALKAIENI